jgi:hypothetical protein
MTTFKSVKRDNLLKAFTLAHRCACNPDIGDKERKLFRAVAYEIWKACGESDAMPKTLPVEAQAVGITTAAEAIAAGRKAYEEATRG